MHIKLLIDKINIKGEFKHFWEKGIGTGRAILSLREDFRDHMRDARKHIGCTYARFHGIFHEDMGIYSEDEEGNQIFNWSYIDKVYDFYVSIGMKIFVDLDFMPELLASGTQTHFWWKTNVTPPKDYDKWYNLVKAFTMHLVDRYGIEELRTWRFEVWNEPNLSLFWSGTKEEYFKLYDYSVRAIKSVDAELKVGGPAIAGGNSVEWVEAFIAFCRQRELPFDFISAHCYEIGPGYQEGVSKRIISVKERIYNSVEKVRGLMNAANTEAELHYTEWGSCTTLFDVIQDMEFQAPFILRTVKKVQDLGLDSFSFWTHSDVFEEQGINRYPFKNGFGMINMHGLWKAAFNTFVMMKKLGDVELETGCESCFATTSNQNRDIQIALWNYIPFKEVEEHDRFEYDSSGVEKYDIAFNNVEGSFILKKYQIDKHHSNVYQKWVDMGEPQYPTLEQLNYLKKNMALEEIESREVQINRDTHIEVEVPACGAVLILLTKKEQSL